jgi:hypothetical protein
LILALFNRNYIHLRLGTRKTGLFKSSSSEYLMQKGGSNAGYPSGIGQLGFSRLFASGDSIGQFTAQNAKSSGSSMSQFTAQNAKTGVTT